MPMDRIIATCTMLRTFMIKGKANVASYMLKSCMDNIDSHSVAKNNLFMHNHA